MLLFFPSDKGSSQTQGKAGKLFLYVSENNIVKLKLGYAGVQVKVDDFICYISLEENRGHKGA